MVEAIVYSARRAVRWVWIAVIVGLVCAALGVAAAIIGTNSVSEPDTVIEKPIKKAITQYSDWEKSPNAHRYAIYSLELDPTLLSEFDSRTDPLTYLSLYGEMIRQNINSIETMNLIYQRFIQQYTDLNHKYLSFDITEMIAIYYVEHSTLVVCANAPLSLNRDKDGKELDKPLYSDKVLCEMRDYVHVLLAESIENNEYLQTLPVRLKRISLASENTLSEQSLLSDIRQEKMAEAAEGDAPAEGPQPVAFPIKKAICLFVFGSLLGYLALFFAVFTNGKIKTGKELEETSNLRVYDDFLRVSKENALGNIAVKLGMAMQLNDLYLVSLEADGEDSAEIAEALETQIGNWTGKKVSIHCEEWNNDINSSVLERLKDSHYLILLKQNKSRKQMLGSMAKDTAQINAICLGAILCK